MPLEQLLIKEYSLFLIPDALKPKFYFDEAYVLCMNNQRDLLWGGVMVRADTDGSCGKPEFSSVGSCKQTDIIQHRPFNVNEENNNFQIFIQNFAINVITFFNRINGQLLKEWLIKKSQN
jgi:hypothetical protein